MHYRGSLVLASPANGLAAPIDTVWINMQTPMTRTGTQPVSPCCVALFAISERNASQRLAQFCDGSMVLALAKHACGTRPHLSTKRGKWRWRRPVASDLQRD